MHAPHSSNLDELFALLLHHRGHPTPSSWQALQHAVEALTADPVRRGELWEALFERLEYHVAASPA